MAFTYKWSDLIIQVSKQVKNIPTQQLDALHCDMVSAEIAGRLPWKPQLTTIADGQIPLVDGQQDYDPPFNMWRLIEASLCCTSVTPNDVIDIAVRDSLAVDLYRRSPYAITSVAREGGVGQLRLSSAVGIPTGATWELRGIYQFNPTKVSATSQILWFDDRYVSVAIEGLTYWYMKMADDPRVGTTTSNLAGEITGYSGQYGTYMAALKRMADAEDIGGDMQAMPDDPLGISAQQYGSIVAMYGYGSGTGGGGLMVNFADNETVSGSGTSWTLAHVPNPPANLELFQYLGGFGNILLKAGSDYILSGMSVTTNNSLSAGALTAWYRW